MPRVFLFLTILLGLVTQIQTHPIDFLRRFSSVSSSPDRNWLGWVWGADSEVSVVDRFPPLTFPSRPAAFGPELTNPLLGYVIPLSSFTEPCSGNLSSIDVPPNIGCPSLCVVGRHEPEPTETWIALVQRGKCPFVAKVREAQRLGAKAVVVGGDDPETSGNPDALVNMYSQEDSSDVTIASTFIKYSDYMMLSSLIASSNTSHSGLRTLSLLITTEYSAWEWYSPILTFIIILLLPSSLTFMTLLIHRIRAVRAAQRDRAPENIVQSLPWRVWTGSGWEKHDGIEQNHKADPAVPPTNVDLEGGPAESSEALVSEAPSSSQGDTATELPWCETQLECAICLSEFAKGDKVRVLPCHHIFHIDEVDEWLIHRKKLCPICKADVTRPPHNQHPHSRGHPGPATTEEVGREASETQRSSSRTQTTRLSTAPPTERTPLLDTSAPPPDADP